MDNNSQPGSRSTYKAQTRTDGRLQVETTIKDISRERSVKERRWGQKKF